MKRNRDVEINITLVYKGKEDEFKSIILFGIKIEGEKKANKLNLNGFVHSLS